MRSHKTLKSVIILVLILIFFVFLNLTPASNKIKNFFYLISSPFQKVLWDLGHKTLDIFSTIGEVRNLKRENEELKIKNEELTSQKVQLAELKKENEILRETLGLGLEKEFKLILSDVIGKDISQDFILIDKGVSDGISQGMAVITPQKTLVGRVSEVYANFSRVILISSEKSSFDAEVQERDVSGVVKGKGNFKIYMDLIPQEKEIKEEDIVITSPLGGVFPKGLLVGQISKILKSDINPFQQVQVGPAFDIRRTESLFIIISY